MCLGVGPVADDEVGGGFFVADVFDEVGDIGGVVRGVAGVEGGLFAAGLDAECALDDGEHLAGVGVVGL